jgi:hypothetical protein
LWQLKILEVCAGLALWHAAILRITRECAIREVSRLFSNFIIRNDLGSQFVIDYFFGFSEVMVMILVSF